MACRAALAVLDVPAHERLADNAGMSAGTCRRVLNLLRDRGVLVGPTGDVENVLKIRPPMVFTRDHADLLVDRLDAAPAVAGG